MPEITQADRDAARAVLQVVYGRDLEIVTDAETNAVEEHLAAHREAERERLRPIIEGSYSAVSIAQDGLNPTVEPAVYGELEGLKERLCDELNGKTTTTELRPGGVK